MTKTWVYSDPHFYHKNIVKFTNYDGTKVRPWDDSDVMTEEMIQWYNDLVSDSDRVYVLGDVSFTPAGMKKSLSAMKGRKVLVPGNHDPVKMRKYFDLLDDVRGYVVKKGFVMSHMPIHEQSLSRWKLNIHGHLHNNQVMRPGFKQWIEKETRRLDTIEYEVEVFKSDYSPEPDPRYYCACVERTNFRPKLLDEILHERGLK